MYRFAPVALVPILLGSSLGCDISAKPYAGTVLQMTLTGASTSAAGQHYEIWARTQYNDTVRISSIFDTTLGGKDVRLLPYGFVVRPAITMDDPCMIDPTTGALLIKAEAYKDADVAGVHQTPEEQAQQIRTRIAQLTPGSSCDASPEASDPVLKAYHCGHQGNSVLYALIAYELVDKNGMVTSISPESPRTCETSGNAAGCIPFGAAPADRLTACRAYWDSSPLAYTPSPLQITAPFHGQQHGLVSYVSVVPPGVFDSIRINSDVALRGVQELWMTAEPDQLDVPAPGVTQRRGPIFLDGTPDEGGRGVVHIDLSQPVVTAMPVSGTAALLVELDQDPVQF